MRQIVINCRGNKGQEEAVKWWFSDSDVTELLWTSGRGGGKSFLGLSCVFSAAFMYPRTYYYVARASLTSLRRYTIPTINEVFKGWGITKDDYKFHGMDNYFELYNGSRVYLVEASYQPSDPLYTRLASSFYTAGFIEEANELDIKAKNQLFASTGRHLNDVYGFKGKLLMVCNPDPNSFLYGQFYKPYIDGTLPDFRRYLFSSPRDNKMLPKDYISNLEQSLSFSEAQRLINGVWEYFEDEDNLVTYSDIENVFSNEPENGSKRISVDLSGGTGRDSSIGVYWNGTEGTIFMNTNIKNAKEIQATIEEKVRETGAQVIYDADGVGKYLGSYINAIEFHNNGKALTPVYSNIKSECAWKLAELIKDKKLRINCSDDLRKRVKEELILLKKKNNDEQKRQLISKEEMKKINGRSPDCLDALIYGMYGLIKQPAKGIKKHWC